MEIERRMQVPASIFDQPGSAGLLRAHLSRDFFRECAGINRRQIWDS
jgi:hypothetical protein